MVAQPYRLNAAAKIWEGKDLATMAPGWLDETPTLTLETFRYRQRFGGRPYEAVVYRDPEDERLVAGIDLVVMAGRMLERVKRWCGI